jgi:hypothetical protein
MAATPESMIATLEARIKALETKTESWFAKNWPHLVTYAGLLAPYVLKHL